MSDVAASRKTLVRRERAGLRPGVTTGRIAAGAAGGFVGGLLFGGLMFTGAMRGAAAGALDFSVLLPRVRELLGTLGGPVWSTTLAVWVVHMLLSTALGVLFSLFVSPRTAGRSIPWGLAYGVVLWLIGAVVLLPILVGDPVSLGAPAIGALVGHLLFGFGLGAVYPSFHRLEIVEMLDSESPRVRRWARRERDS